MKDRYNEIITMNEVTNNGRQVHLYYEPSKNEFQAYGYSAYIIAHAFPSVMPSYAEDEQMPMVEVDDYLISRLKKKLDEIRYIENEYYLMEAEKPINENDYTCWVAKVRGEE
jgi:hypothetical protein